MATIGLGRPTDSYHDNRNFTTVVLHGRRDCNPEYPTYQPDLTVFGGARIYKRLCVGGKAMIGGDLIVEGNLFVLGQQIVEQVTCVTVEDKNICLGNVVGQPASDLTASGGGVIIKGPQPGGSKTWLWYHDIGTDGAWHSNQDIDIGSGRHTGVDDNNCYSCGSDTSDRGYGYRIDGQSVLTLYELGPTVIYSSLTTVGTLREGSIDAVSHIVSTIPSGPVTCINTSEAHLLNVGDTVFISGANGSPSINGCQTVSAVISPTEFKIAQITTIAGTAVGTVYGPNFSINIGTAPITSGTHKVVCGEELIVENQMGFSRFTYDGSAEQLRLINNVSQAYSQNITTNISGSFAGVQRGLQINNTTEGTAIGSVSAGADILQCYNGTNTTFLNINDTVINDGARIIMKTNPQAPVAKISARGIDVTSNSSNNRGSNVGVFAEGGGPLGTEHSAGVMGFTNPDSGTFSTGVLGCANRTRSDIADLVTSVIGAGGLTVGVFACNPENGPGDYAVYAMGNSEFVGEMIIEGNSTVNGDLTATSVTTPLACITDLLVDSIVAKNGADILLTGNLLPLVSDTYSLGDETHKYQEAWLGNLHVCDTATVNDLYVTGNLYANIGMFVIPDPLIIGTLCATNVITDRLEGKTQDTIDVTANLVPDSTNCLTLGTPSDRWCNGHFEDLNIYGNTYTDGLTANLITALTIFAPFACIDNLLVDYLIAKNGTDIGVIGNLNPSITDTYTLGNITNQWASVSANVGIFNTLSVSGKITADELCINNNALIMGDLVVMGNIHAEFINIQGNCITSSDASSEVCVLPGGMVTITGDTQLTGDFTVSGTTTLNDDVTINANVHVNGKITADDLCVLNNTEVFGNLVVDGTTILNDDVTVNANVDINGKLTVDDLCVLKDSMMGNLTANTITSNGDLIVNGNAIINGKLTAIDLCVLNDTEVLGNLKADQITANALTLTGNLQIDGTTIFNSPVTVNANVDINGKLTVDDLCVLNDSEVFGNLQVNGITTLNDKLTVNANVDINGKLTVDDLCVLNNSDSNYLTTLSNEGGGIGIWNESTSNSLKSLFGATDGISITSNANSITINNTLSGSNIGTGAGTVFSTKVGSNLQFNTLAGAATSGLLIYEPVGGTITLSNTLSGSNIGIGTGTVFSSKVGSNLQFNTLLGTANGLSVSAPVSGTITIDCTITGSNVGLGCNLFLDKTGSNLIFRSIFPGSFINIAQNPSDVTVNVNGSASAKVITIATDQLTVTTVTATDVAYYALWDNTRYGEYATRTIAMWVIPSSGTRDLIVDIANNGGAILGTTTIPGGSATGYYSFTFTAPGANTRLDFRIYRSAGTAPNPEIYGINMNLT